MSRRVVAALLLWAGCAQAGLVPDPGFGVAGSVDLAFDAAPYYYDKPALVVLPDHRVIVATATQSDTPQPPMLQLAQLLPDGQPDPAFGQGGRTVVTLSPQLADNSQIADFVRLADGKMLVLVTTTVSVPPEPTFVQQILLVRLNADGSADPSFNAGQARVLDDRSGGELLTYDDGHVIAISAQSSGNDASGFVAQRIRADGSPDPAFGTAGVVAVAPAGSISRGAMPLSGGGFQILHEVRPGPAGAARNFWRRYRADGTLDTDFGTAGDQPIALTESYGMTALIALADGTYLGLQGPCVMRRFDAQGAVIGSPRSCTGSQDTTNFTAQVYGERLLFSGESGRGWVLPPASAGTYLHVTDQAGRVDSAFAAPQDTRWRPPESPNASYAVAADGGDRIVLARNHGAGVRLLRYRELRGGEPSIAPVPALGLPALMLAIAGLIALAWCQRTGAIDGTFRRPAHSAARRASMNLFLAAVGLCAASAASAEVVPDVQFGGTGVVDVALPAQNWSGRVPEMAALPDGGVLLVSGIVAAAAPEPPRIAVTRLRVDGRADTAFGAAGTRVLDLGGAPAALTAPGEILIRPDGDAVLLVGAPAAPGVQVPAQLWVVRLDPDGQFDAGFNGGAPRAITLPRGGFTRLLPHGDGFLLFVFGVDRRPDGSGSAMDVLRLRADGSIDPDFGDGGMLADPIRDSVSQDAIVLPDGSFQVLRVKPASAVAAPRNYWYRHRADGSLDTAYGNAGVQEIAQNSDATELVAVFRLSGGDYLLSKFHACMEGVVDAEGNYRHRFSTCFNTLAGGWNVLPFGDKALLWGHLPPLPPATRRGTLMYLMERTGQRDTAFGNGGEFVPHVEPEAYYGVATRGEGRFYLARRDAAAYRVLRYVDRRGGTSVAEPVPALGLPALLAMLAGVLGLAWRQRG